MLGDRGPGGGGDEGCGGGDVEGSGHVAAGAAGVDQAGPLVGGEGDRDGALAEGVDEAGELLLGFTACPHGAEQCGEAEVVLRVRGGSFEQGLEQGAGVVAREREASFDDLDERGGQRIFGFFGDQVRDGRGRHDGFEGSTRWTIAG